jgi:hypothetical protein
LKHAPDRDGQIQVQRSANARTAAILASIALVLFGGVIFAQYSGDGFTGIGVTGFAIIGFLLALILRHTHRKSTK